MPNIDWTRQEVEAVVDDYRQMLIQQFYGQAVNKAEHNRRLRERLQGRSKGSVEFKHANISAVLDEMGFPTFLKGWVTCRAGTSRRCCRRCLRSVFSRTPSFLALPPMWQTSRLSLLSGSIFQVGWSFPLRLEPRRSERTIGRDHQWILSRWKPGTGRWAWLGRSLS